MGYCHLEEENITDVDKMKTILTKGDHISMRGRLKCLGKFYRHHAIVLNIDGEDIRVIEFDYAQCDCSIRRCWCKPDKFKIEENTYPLQNLRDVRKLKYHFPDKTSLSDPEKIIEEAKSIKRKDPKYNVLKYNCEHFCHLACTGVKSSEQAQQCASAGPIIVKWLLRICFLGALTADDILWKESKCRIFIPLLVIIINSLLYVIVEYNLKHKFCVCSCFCIFHKKFCDQCRSDRKTKAKVGFVLLIVCQVSGLGLIIYLGDKHGLPLYALVPISIGVSFMTFILMWFTTLYCQKRNRRKQKGVQDSALV